MASIIGKEYTMQKVVPILLELIKDDNAEVKLNVVSGMVKIANVVREELLTSPFLN
jgi:hypothetical protein